MPSLKKAGKAPDLPSGSGPPHESPVVTGDGSRENRASGSNSETSGDGTMALDAILQDQNTPAATEFQPETPRLDKIASIPDATGLASASTDLTTSQPTKQMIGLPVTNNTEKNIAAETATPAEIDTIVSSSVSACEEATLQQASAKSLKAAKPAVKTPVSGKPAAALKTEDMRATARPVEKGEKTEKAPAKATGKATGGSPRHGFKPLEFIVYPSHGVGQILAIEEQEVAGFKLELFVISFIKDKMILKVPTPKAVSVRMRKLADASVIDKALETLTGRARIKRTMWSRRAQEYEAKINSGDLIAVSEVVRDLYRSDAQPEQSYSERQLYEAALDRVVRELAAVQRLTETESLKLIEAQLQKGPKRGSGKVEEIDLDEADEDGDIEEAA